MAEEFANCPTNKNIHSHFKDQLFQLGIDPRTQQDHNELMDILNKYLSYPDDELANHHRLANKLGILDIEATQRRQLIQTHTDEEFKNNMKQTRIFKVNNQSCHCCGFFVQPEDINSCTISPKHIKNLGVANKVYFQTFCYLAVLLAIMLIVYSIFAFATNVSVARSTNYLENGQTLDYLAISLGAKSRQTKSPNNDGQKFYYVSAWLGVLMLLLWAFVFGCIRRQTASIEYHASRLLRISDFSIVIQNMPTDITKQQIQQSFDKYLQQRLQDDLDKTIRLRQIDVVTYNQGKPFYLDQKQFKDNDLQKLLKDHHKYKEQIASYVIQYKNHKRFQTPRGQRTYTYNKYQQVQIAKQKKYQEILAKMRRKLQAKADTNRTVAFVTFATHQQRNFVIQNNKNTLFYKLKRFLQFWKNSDYFKVKKGQTQYDDIIIQIPPEPQDINWGNLGLTNCQKFCRMCITFFVSLIMVGISLLIVYGLSTVQKNNNNQRFISILISLVISITNLLIIKVIQFMTVYEKVYSMNNYQISIAIKSVIVQLINSIAVPILVNYYLKDGNVFGRSGLIQDIFILAIASSFVAPIVKLIDPWNLLLILRFKYYSDQERRLYLNQYQLNEISERMEFEIGLQYIYLLHNFIFICFFVSLQPIIPAFAVLGYLLMYWIQKYALFSRCQRPVPGPDTITSKLYQFIFFGAVAFALGNLTWSWFLPDKGFRNALVPNLVTLGLALIIFLFPYQKVVSRQAERQQKDYYQKRIYFPSQYDRLNPSTARQAIQQYRQYLMKKKAQLQGGNTQLQNQIMQGFQNLSQNNFYKPNYLNRLSANDQDLAIQQIFYNQTKNVIPPQLLYQAIMPAHRSQHNPRSDQNMYPDLQGANSLPPINKRGGPNIKKIQRSVLYNQPTSKQMLYDQRNPHSPQASFDPLDILHPDMNNVYRSNINLDNLKNDHIKITDSKIIFQNKHKRNSK